MTDRYKIDWLDLGRIDYQKSYAIQEYLHGQRRNGKISDLIIFQECYPVLTIGKTGSEKHLLLSKEELAQRNIDIVYTSRGGDITYHGPGQLIISPLLYLRDYMGSVVKYLRLLEGIVISLLEDYGICGERVEGASGVWVNQKKLAAIGIAIKNGVTQHGIALNVAPNLSHFEWIIPCGLKNTGITSLDDLGISNISMEKVKEDFLREFSSSFNVEIHQKPIKWEVFKNDL
ncbi:MAG: lipoyl(octanoyl) transferase LipB [Thermotaleaceae bacterium]